MKNATTIMAILALAMGLVLGVSGIAMAEETYLDLHNGITYSEKSPEATQETGNIEMIRNGITLFEGGVVESREATYAAGGPAEAEKPLYNGVTVFESSAM